MFQLCVYAQIIDKTEDTYDNSVVFGSCK